MYCKNQPRSIPVVVDGPRPAISILLGIWFLKTRRVLCPPIFPTQKLLGLLESRTKETDKRHYGPNELIMCVGGRGRLSFTPCTPWQFSSQPAPASDQAAHRALETDERRVSSATHSSQFCTYTMTSRIEGKREELTAINLLVHRRLHLARIPFGGRVHGQHTGRPVGAALAEEAIRIHDALQRIALPAKQIVGMSRIPGIVTCAPHERLTAVFRPEFRIVEHGRVPHGLVRHLRHAHWMRGRAGTCWLEAALGRVIHMRLMIGWIEVLAVPTAGGLLARAVRKEEGGRDMEGSPTQESGEWPWCLPGRASLGTQKSRCLESECPADRCSAAPCIPPHRPECRWSGCRRSCGIQGGRRWSSGWACCHRMTLGCSRWSCRRSGHHAGWARWETEGPSCRCHCERGSTARRSSSWRSPPSRYMLCM